ncbi:hypothetical protein [Actinocrispum wychmicini]|uniref:Excreted virulence factor EspC (Type VII ESX diderm) n=1 Tax=Actinocrispum wychmicini TaxID=1213861 RepID=A0A4R2IS04_9PSEU|nr:hypothetical protein [Actinocrispum wychmicini]TCO47974.1 hypothetical protein EV192_11626 [Actinocrispum wychmicini]
MDGFTVEPGGLDRAANAALSQQEELVSHPATRWELADRTLGDDDLAAALAEFQAASRQALDVLSRDWGELADRYQQAAARYRATDAALAERIDDLARELEN